MYRVFLILFLAVISGYAHAQGLNVDNAKLIIGPGAVVASTGTTTLTGSECLVIQADAQRTASFLDNGTITYISGATAKVERYFPANQISYVSPPVSGATREVFTGTQKLFEYDATAGAWLQLTINNTPLERMRGYVVKFSSATTVGFVGQLNTSAMAAGGTGNVTLINGGTYGYNLIGNPYPSHIDLSSENEGRPGWTLGSNIQTWASFRKSDGNIGYWESSGNGTAVNGGSRYVPPGQGYWINLEPGSDWNYQMTNTCRVHRTQNIFKTTTIGQDNIFRITSSHNGYTDEAVIGFYTDGNPGPDKYDIGKMFIEDEHFGLIYTEESGEELVLNGNGPLENNRSFSLGFKCITQGDYSLEANFAEFDQSTGISLEDHELNVIQDLRQNPVYSFSSNTTYSSSRFTLHFTTARISGTLTYDNQDQTALPGVVVQLMNADQGVEAETTTDSAGNFEFVTGFTPGMYIRATSSAAAGGWNAVDALQILKHFTGYSTLTGMKYSAADVNKDGGVNSIDAMLIQKRFVGLSFSYPAGDWFFQEVPVAFTAAGEHIVLDIKGICVGDVNGSYIP